MYSLLAMFTTRTYLSHVRDSTSSNARRSRNMWTETNIESGEIRCLDDHQVPSEEIFTTESSLWMNCWSRSWLQDKDLIFECHADRILFDTWSILARWHVSRVAVGDMMDRRYVRQAWCSRTRIPHIRCDKRSAYMVQKTLMLHPAQHWYKYGSDPPTWRILWSYFEFHQAKNAAVTSGGHFSARIPTSRSEQSRSRSSSAQSLIMHIHWAQGSLERMCKLMSCGTAGGHHLLLIGGTGGQTGTRRSLHKEISPTRDCDLCKQYTTSACAQRATFFSCGSFYGSSQFCVCYICISALPKRFAGHLHSMFHPSLLVPSHLKKHYHFHHDILEHKIVNVNILHCALRKASTCLVVWPLNIRLQNNLKQPKNNL